MTFAPPDRTTLVLVRSNCSPMGCLIERTVVGFPCAFQNGPKIKGYCPGRGKGPGTRSARPADWPAWLFLAQAKGKREPRNAIPVTACARLPQRVSSMHSGSYSDLVLVFACLAHATFLYHLDARSRRCSVGCFASCELVIARFILGWAPGYPWMARPWPWGQTHVLAARFLSCLARGRSSEDR
ncbi:hypothetical protein VTN96DRAFT_3923 [Rasamsonia emersonii]